MPETQRHPKRLIEVDLPIRGISEHARREKAIRQGHISTLHIWWARRPLGACRAVTCAALWLDPADPSCPAGYAKALAAAFLRFTATLVHNAPLASLFAQQSRQWEGRTPAVLNAATAAGRLELRHALLDLLVPLSSWEATENLSLLALVNELTDLSHRFASLDRGGSEKPVCIDPFSGGGTIPVEALRVGADAIAIDLNPVAALLNRVLVEYGPQFGERLPEAIAQWGDVIARAAKSKLARFYPGSEGTEYPSSYLWARTVACEGPGCGIRFPLLRSAWIVKKGNKSVSIDIRVDSKGLCTVGPKNGSPARTARGTISKGAALCPACSYTMPVERVRAQLREKHGGADDGVLYAVVWSGPNGKQYRAARTEDLKAVEYARRALQDRPDRDLPDEPTPNDGTGSLGGGYRTRKYGVETFKDFFTSRQRLALKVLTDVLLECAPAMTKELGHELGAATHVCLALAIDRCVNQLSAFSKWNSSRELVDGVFARQAIPMLWDFGELNPIGGPKCYWHGAVAWVEEAIARIRPPRAGRAFLGSATELPLPDDAADALFTDPPYYDAVPYAELADFFWVWLRRSLPREIGIDLTQSLTPKADECVVNLVIPRDGTQPKDSGFFERTMTKALAESRRVVRPGGIGVVVFAHKSTAGWEAQLQAMVDAGWIITASWPIDTERPARLRAQNSAALASSVHLVCRPRDSVDSSLEIPETGEWRSVLEKLPVRIHEWLPRLAQEGVVGADAIFACLGPALEVFSSYSRVEKVSGEKVELREYLEHVWAAVSREALSMIFEGAETAGLEPDARVTAIWLWTLLAPSSSSEREHEELGDESDEVNDEETAGARQSASSGAGFILEFDAARKIAQGLGARLEELTHVVQIGGGKARLFSVSERASYLFRGPARSTSGAAKKKQLVLFSDLQSDENPDADNSTPLPGSTALDRVHQAMLLFGAGRSSALKRFLVEEGVGSQTPFWKLAQSLSALYPGGSEEKRWVDGLLARKKGLGFG